MIDYKIDRSEGIIFTTVYGSTSVEEFVVHFKYMFNDPHFQPNYHIVAKIEKDTIIDARLPEEPEIIQNLLMNYAEQRDDSKCAIVIESEATREIVEYGLNLIEYISSDVQVFGNKDDALEWIGISLQEKEIIEKSKNV
jgi:hypothetical protein